MTNIRMSPTSIDYEKTSRGVIVWFYSVPLDVGVCFGQEDLKEVKDLERVVKAIKKTLEGK